MYFLRLLYSGKSGPDMTFKNYLISMREKRDKSSDDSFSEVSSSKPRMMKTQEKKSRLKTNIIMKGHESLMTWKTTEMMIPKREEIFRKLMTFRRQRKTSNELITAMK